MRIQENASQLTSALSAVKKVIRPSANRPHSECMLIQIKADKMLITGTDDSSELMTQFTLSQKYDDIEIVVNASSLLGFLSTLSPDLDVQFDAVGDTLTINQSNSQIVLPLMDPKSFPSFPEDDENQQSIQLDRIKLLYALQTATYSAAKADVRCYFNGVHFKFLNGVLSITSTNGHQLATIEQDIPGDLEYEAIVPIGNIPPLLDLVYSSDQETVSFSCKKGTLDVSINETVFKIRLIDSQYPDIDKVLPKFDEQPIACIDMSVLKQAMQKASACHNARKAHNSKAFSGLTLIASEGTIKLAILKDHFSQVEFKDQVECEFDGSSVELMVEVNYLNECIKHLDNDDDKVEIAFASNSKALLLRPNGFKEQTHLIMGKLSQG